jgi:hypothetical protein
MVPVRCARLLRRNVTASGAEQLHQLNWRAHWLLFSLMLFFFPLAIIRESEAKLSLYITSRQKVLYESVEVRPHAFLISVLDGGK